MWAVIASI